jgi:transcriptional pleiotropic regulator of transition state genes
MMGMARRIDQLGRVVVPAEFRKLLCIDALDQLEMHVEEEKGHLVLRRVAPACAICGSADILIDVRDRFVCSECAGEIRRQP